MSRLFCSPVSCLGWACAIDFEVRALSKEVVYERNMV